jgi:hypothetical protein
LYASHLVRNALGLIVLLAAGLSAQLPPLLTTLTPEVGEAGHPLTLKVYGPAGDHPWMLISGHPGSLDVPGIGTILVGVGPDLMILPLGTIPPAGVLEASCAPPCGTPVTLAPCFLQVLSFNATLTALSGLGGLHALNVVGADCGRCVSAAVSDLTYYGASHAHAFYLPGIGTDFVFVAGGTLVERGNGYGHLSGVIARVSKPSERFLVDIDLQQGVHPGELGYPPAGSPKLELNANAYFDNGGPVDPRTWHYYEQSDGRLSGLADFAGAVLTVHRIGPAFQVGFGANGKNAHFGASGWFDVQITHQPTSGSQLALNGHGDINVDLDGDCGDCAYKAVPDAQWSASQYTHSFYLPEIGKDFAFDPPGQYVEYADGTARLTGKIHRLSNPNKGFDVDVVFDQRVNPGAAIFPPVGSPKKSLLPSAYVENGGPVDPTTWHYFQTIDGTLSGIDDYAGSLLKITRDGPAFQVGYGANDKNLKWGASGWLIVKILSQPSFGNPFPSTLDSGDINIDLEDCK